jgi:hypothetical protein
VLVIGVIIVFALWLSGWRTHKVDTTGTTAGAVKEVITDTAQQAKETAQQAKEAVKDLNK